MVNSLLAVRAISHKSAVVGKGCERIVIQKNNLDSVCMIDMHAHLLCLSEEHRGKLTEQEMSALAAQELAVRREYGIDTVFSCGTPQEWAIALWVLYS